MSRQYALGLVLTLCFAIVIAAPLSAQDFKTKPLSERIVSTGEVEYVKGEILVKYKESAPQREMTQALDVYGLTLMSSHRGGVRKFAVPADKTEQEMIDLLQGDPNVEYAELNTICHAHMTPNDPYYDPYQWHFPIINCPTAWDISTGNGVVVAILDSGIAYENYPVPSYELDTVQSGVTEYMIAPELNGTSFTSGYDFVNDDSHPNDNDAHGTHVAGTIAQVTNNNSGTAGMAFDCTLMPVKILDYSGSGTAGWLADGLYWAADNGAQVINMSLGWPPGYNPGSTVQNAIQYAYNAGVVLCASSGNAGQSPVSYPAAYSEVIAVGATRYDDERAEYSQYGSDLEVVAPGGDIFVDQNGDGYGDGVLLMTFTGYNPGPPEELADPTDFGYWFYEGTSMACPHTVALVAMMIANGQTGVENIRTILHETAVDLGATGWDQYYGYGRIDAYAALTYGEIPPVADFSGDPRSGDAPLTVNFTDLSTGSPTSWYWDFGDGVGTSTEQNPSYTYDTEGFYTVSLTATNAYGSDTETKVDYIEVTSGTPPVADFSGSPTSGAAPLTVDFTDLSSGSPISWYWDFGDGVGTSTEQNPSYTYDTEGFYTVSLTATNAYGSDTETKVDYINVTSGEIVKAFALSDIPVAGSVTGDYTATHTSDDAYEIITERESGGKPSNRHSYLEHKWDFNVAAGSSITFYVEAYRPNNSDGDDFTFAYSTDDVNYTSLVTVNSATETVYSAAMPSVSGTVYIRVTDTDQTQGNRSLDAVFVDYMYIESVSGPAPPVADFSGDPTSGAAPLTVNFTDLSSGSPTSWYWDFGDGVGTSTEQNPSYTYGADGKYTVSLTATNEHGSDTETKSDYINVSSGGCFMHVHDMPVTRKTAGINCSGQCTVWIVDQNGAAVANATVYVTATGPVGGTYSGLTVSDGSVFFETGKTRDCSGEWCFEVTDVTHASCTYDAAANLVTKSCESGDVFGTGDAIARQGETLPKTFWLGPNNPNPFTGATTIKFNLVKPGYTRLEVFNAAGRRVAKLVDRDMPAGMHAVKWNADGVPAGVYFCRLISGVEKAATRMILVN